MPILNYIGFLNSSPSRHSATSQLANDEVVVEGWWLLYVSSAFQLYFKQNESEAITGCLHDVLRFPSGINEDFLCNIKFRDAMEAS